MRMTGKRRHKRKRIQSDIPERGRAKTSDMMESEEYTLSPIIEEVY